MTFVNLSLLAGSALVAVPIILHLIMRRRPKLLEFPALRFIQKQHDANRRRLRLRHLLLLLLRAGIIAILAFALARPSVRLGGGVGSQEAPVAATLVFDAAPHMEYRHANNTRLDAAKELATWLLAQLPEASEVGVVDTRLGTSAAFEPDRGAAKDRVARLEPVANSQSLPEAIDAAVRLVRRSNLPRKEVYIFTDLSRGAWPEVDAAALQRQLAQLPNLGVYVIDVGVADPRNFGLGEVRLSGDVLSSRGTLAVEADVSCVGPGAVKVVEMHVADADGKPQKRSEQSCDAAPGELRPLEFRLSNLAPGTRQGSLRIVGQDGLAADDVRYFTVAVRPPWRVLVAAPRPVRGYAIFLTEALAPAGFRKRGQAQFDCDTCDLAELAGRKLNDYAAVCLLDPAPLPPPVWKKLADFASEGRGVAIFLGRNAQPIDSFNEPAAQELLPGKLVQQARRSDDGLHLAPRDYQHPILAALREYADSTPWADFPVFRYWQIEQPASNVGVVVPYSDGKPAILERRVGQGRVLVMTTPVSDRLNRNAWNLLPAGDAWPFMILINKMAAYLVGGSEQQFNYRAGQTAVVELDASDQRRSYLLTTPGGLSYPVSADLKRHELSTSATDQVGNYRIQAGGTTGVDLGFSVNYAPDQTRLDRLGDGELAGIFGPVKFRLARTREQIDRDVSMGRVGRELFPPLVLIVALMLALELLVANRFYGEQRLDDR